MKKVMLILAAVLLLAGCVEQEKPQQWGQGNPPDRWQQTFGNDNIARLNYVQSEMLNNHQRVIYGSNASGPEGKPILDREGKPTRVPGIIEYLNSIEAAIRKLHPPADPNEITLDKVKSL